MRLGIVHPTVWPDVRRGTERFIDEYATFLAARGCQVTVVASSEAGSSVRRMDGYSIEYHRRLWRPRLERVGLHEYHVFALTALLALRRRRFDVIHCFNFMDALAAIVARRWTKTAVLLHLANIPPEVEYRRVATSGGRFLKMAVQRADRVLTVSRFQRDYFVRRTQREDLRLIHPPIDLQLFSAAAKPPARPQTILFASAAQDRRKGIRVLFRAFELLRRRRPDVSLDVASDLPDALRRELLDLLSPRSRQAVRFLGVTAPTEFPALLGQASVLALPSLWEAFPLVAMESLAVGTPVVGTRDGGIPELIADPKIGVLFDPGLPDRGEPSNEEALMEALLQGLELSLHPGTAGACRQTAEKFAWTELGPVYMDLLQDCAGYLSAGASEPAITATG